MKHVKNRLLLVISGFIILTMVNLACSKSNSNNTPPVPVSPTITSFTPASAKSGETVTITGTNFTGATSVSFGGTAASSFTVVNATTITAVVGTGASGDVKVVTAAGPATKSGFTLTAPQIDGYDNSNQVAKDSLRAHWSFDVSNNEDISGKAPEKAVGTSFTPGMIGQALKLTSGYLVYPVIPALGTADTLQSYTLSLWVNSPATSSAMSSFFQMTGEVFPDIWGQIEIAANTHWGHGGDTLVLNTRFTQIDGTSPYVHAFNWDLDPLANAAWTFHGANQWSLLTVSYNQFNDSLTVYGNGVEIAAKKTGVVAAPATFILQQPIRALIGTFAFSEDGFANAPSATGPTWAGHGITASIDDIRMFNAALNPAQIKALYDLGKAGR
ncbi:MAG TPA: IPT/TIG domain-containing protein [Puia sp.]